VAGHDCEVVTELGSEDDDPSDPDPAEFDSPAPASPELDASVPDSELDAASLDSSLASELVAASPVLSSLEPLDSPVVAALDDEPPDDLWLTLVSRAFDEADNAGS
jgi:hypothetical protein